MALQARFVEKGNQEPTLVAEIRHPAPELKADKSSRSGALLLPSASEIKMFCIAHKVYMMYLLPNEKTEVYSFSGDEGQFKLLQEMGGLINVRASGDFVFALGRE